MLRRAIRYTRWQTTLARDWARGGAERHRARAHWRAAALRRQVRRLVTAAGREVVVVGLVEHFGDLVAAEPIFRALRRRHPAAMIVHVVGRTWLPLTHHHPEIDHHLPVGCLSEWYLLAGRTGATEYDLHVPGRVCDTCRSVVRPTPPATRGIDLTNYYHHGCLLEIFAKVGGVDLAQVDPQPRLHLASGSPSGRRPPGRYAVIHAASNQAERDWSVPGWREVAARLRDAGLQVGEIGLKPVIAPGGGVLDLTGRPLAETVDLIRGASLFLGIDSGPAHVANAAGVPGVVLLGHYAGYTHRMPFSGGYAEGTSGTVLQHNGPLATLPADAVLEAVRHRLSLCNVSREMPV